MTATTELPRTTDALITALADRLSLRVWVQPQIRVFLEGLAAAVRRETLADVQALAAAEVLALENLASDRGYLKAKGVKILAGRIQERLGNVSNREGPAAPAHSH